MPRKQTECIVSEGEAFGTSATLTCTPTNAQLTAEVTGERLCFKLNCIFLEQVCITHLSAIEIQEWVEDIISIMLWDNDNIMLSIG